MVTYGFITSPEIPEDQLVYSANNGQGYVKDKELHVIGGAYHFVYKTNGWHLRNAITGIDHYLGEGACPTVNLDGINVVNQEYWEAITAAPDEQASDNVGT